MRNFLNRKMPRFFVINPNTDRRFEMRFYAKENVVIKLIEKDERKMVTGVASEIGRRGIRLKTETALPEGGNIQIAFPNTPDHVNCFGRVVWSHPPKLGPGYESGVEVNAWHGITEGEYSFKRFLGNRAKADRRTRPR